MAEDDPVNRELLVQMLRVVAMQVETATDGAIAYEKAREQKFGLILMDMQMPTMDGIDSTRAIRRLPGYESVPILAFTANALSECREMCEEAGMNDFMTKPIRPEHLYAKIRHWLAG